MLCKNVTEAWLICQKGIKLSSDHDLKEAINLQAVEFFYLGAKCVNILSESGEDQDNKLAQACSLCQQALTLSQRIEQDDGRRRFDGKNSEVLDVEKFLPRNVRCSCCWRPFF